MLILCSAPHQNYRHEIIGISKFRSSFGLPTVNQPERSPDGNHSHQDCWTCTCHRILTGRCEPAPQLRIPMSPIKCICEYEYQKREDHVTYCMPDWIKYIPFWKILSRERVMYKTGQWLTGDTHAVGVGAGQYFRCRRSQTVHLTQDTNVQLTDRIPRLASELLSPCNSDITP